MKNEMKELFMVRPAKHSKLCPEVKVGATASDGKSAKFNDGTGEVKFSSLVLVMDMILKDHAVMFKEKPTDGTCEHYFEFNDPKTGEMRSGIVNILSNGTGFDIKWETQMPSNWSINVPMVLMSLSSHIGMWNNKYAKEFANEFSSLKEEVKSDSVEPSTLAKLCDTYFRGLISDDDVIIKHSENESTVGNVRVNGDKAGLVTPDILQEFSPDAKQVAQKKVEEAVKNDIHTKYRIKYDGWSDEERALIPKNILSRYKMDSHIEALAAIIKYHLDKIYDNLQTGMSMEDAMNGHVINAILMGTPGTGKTFGIFALGEMLNIPIYSVPISKNTEEDTFEGKNKFVKGQISYIETPFIQGFERAGGVILEEINLADPAVVTGVMNQACEFPYYVMKDGYERVSRNPYCVIFATMNPNAYGTKKLNPALSSRFSIKMELNQPSKTDFLDILKANGFKTSDCQRVYKAFDYVQRWLENGNNMEYAENMSLRQCLTALNMMSAGISYKQAIDFTMAGAIAEGDASLAAELRDTYIKNLPE